MAQPSRQAGETANRYHLKVEDLKDEIVYANGDVLKDAQWKAARFRGLDNIDHHAGEDLVQEFLVAVWKKRGEYDPGKGVSRRTFARQFIEGKSLNFNRKLKTLRHYEACSLDEKVEGGKPGSRELTHADTVNEESALMPANCRGARRIRTNCDLGIIRDMMRGNLTDWRIFSIRWKYAVTEEELAEVLGWTRARLRWYLRGFEQRYARILGVRRRNRR